MRPSIGVGNEPGQASRGQIIKGLNGFTKEFGLYPTVNKKPSISFKRNT